jgi:multidrug resistance efflux pump
MGKINRKTIIIILLVLLVGGVIGGAIYYYLSLQTIYTDQAEISAPVIMLSPQAAGPLEDLMVNPGDQVKANQVVARVDDQLVKTDVAGLIVSTQTDLGKNFNPGEAVASMIVPDQLRVIAHLDEDKGLNQIKIGQRAMFTVDAYGSKKYLGIVDEISQTSRQSDVVFNISGSRQIKQFDVKIRYDIGQYPELKNGMSARVWIYKK